MMRLLHGMRRNAFAAASRCIKQAGHLPGGSDMNEQQLKHYEDKLAFETDSWDLKVALEAGENVIVIDARSHEAFHKERIPGAISMPYRTMNAETTNRLDKAALIVTYCDGIGCNASTKGALNMTRLGFRVKELIGGLDWWKRDGLETEGESAIAPGASSGCE
jgi:rhodanese-related sulfurtransferase